MACKTPLVASGQLRDPATAAVIMLDTPGWYAWLADDRHTSFHFRHTVGDFTARKERKQRGQWYWVAYRQAHNKLHKLYLGKVEALTAARLCDAAAELACAARPHEN